MILRRFLYSFFPIICSAAYAPLAETAGIPIPGKVLAPQESKFLKGVLHPGNRPRVADKAGP